MLDRIKSHWRIALLVAVLVASTVFLFAPQFAPSPDAAGAEGAEARDGLTNLQFGLDLEGGTRIRAPLLGYTAEDVDFRGDDPGTVAQEVAAELPNTTSTDVNAEFRSENRGAVEVTDEDVSEAQFREALAAAGYADYERVRPGVTEETREAAVRVVEGKINEAGLSGGSAREVTAATGENFILVEVPGEGRSDVIELLEDRGTVRIDIYYPDSGTESGYGIEEAVLTQEDFENVGTASRDQRTDQPYVPVSVVNTDANPAAREFQEAAVEYDVAQQGGSQCTYDTEAATVSHPDEADSPEEYPETQEPCLLLVVDGEVVNAFGMAPTLADSMRSGEWANDGGFRLTTTAFEEAQAVAIDLRAGALPAQLDIEGEGTSSFISPTQGERFKTYSLITGVLSVFAVAGMVFFRYREPEVAVPMTVTALTEVYAMLGFAALVSYPVNLAVVAGFIAVVGTGVDDLVIIADEVMSEGEVNSKKVFDSRFRRAFWVIGAAAATTILAMSPLMVLSLGDLSGFAIFTILGVLIGVLVTRPAYGDVLRTLLTDR